MTSPEQTEPLVRDQLGFPPPYSVLICDDQPELRQAIVHLLGQSADFVVAGEACDGPSCLDQVEAIRPDVLILDVSMPGGGPHIASCSRRLNPVMHIMVFSGRADPATARAMLEAGADQFLLKTGRLRPFFEALEVAHRHLAQL
jgi:two-component system invasion response regulator UvrY